MAPTPSAATLVVAAGLLASCEEPNTTVASLPFDEVFQLAEVVELGEDPSDSVAEVGVFLERRNGGFIVADRLLPRVRTYLETGELEAAFGRFGSGPQTSHPARYSRVRYRFASSTFVTRIASPS